MFEPAQRISADEALRHPYFTTSAAISQPYPGATELGAPSGYQNQAAYQGEAVSQAVRHPLLTQTRAA